MSSSTIYLHPVTAYSFLLRLFSHYSVPPHHAQVLATSLLDADLSGHDTHGILRVPSYLSRVRSGALNPSAAPTLTHLTPVCGLLNAHSTFGHVAATVAIDAAVNIAQTYGIGMVSVKHSNHFGMGATYVKRAVEKGMCAMVFTNSSPAMPAWGGREKLLGVSPIAAGAPGAPGEDGKKRDFVLDIAPSVVARGKVYKALRRGEEIPAGWALDVDGYPTTIPVHALEGTMLPMAEHKGSGLAVMMDVFSGVLSGSAFAGGVTGPHDPSRIADVGHMMIAIKPDIFMSSDEFRRRMRVLYEKVTGSEKMEGTERVWFPGEKEEECKRAREKGIPFLESELAELDREAERVGVGKVERRSENE